MLFICFVYKGQENKQQKLVLSDCSREAGLRALQDAAVSVSGQGTQSMSSFSVQYLTVGAQSRDELCLSQKPTLRAKASLSVIKDVFEQSSKGTGHLRLFLNKQDFQRAGVHSC